jgi:nitrate reductase beta subunit
MENRCPVETTGDPQPRKVMLGIPTLRRGSDGGRA